MKKYYIEIIEALKENENDVCYICLVIGDLYKSKDYILYKEIISHFHAHLPLVMTKEMYEHPTILVSNKATLINYLIDSDPIWVYWEKAQRLLALNKIIELLEN